MVNGSLKSTAVVFLVLGAGEVLKNNITAGLILIVAGYVGYIMYEYTPDGKTPTPPVPPAV